MNKGLFMQILKEDINSAIKEAEINEFYQYGYADTSIRSVAKRAGISAGNIYHYYKSKDELFYELLGPVVNEIISIIEVNEFENTGPVYQDDIQSHLEKQVFKITEVILRKRIEISILLYGSRGTKYENIKDIFVKSLYEHIKEHIELKQVSIHDEMAWVMAVSIIEGYLELIRRYYDHPLFMSFLKTYFELHFQGWVDFFTISCDK